MNSDRWERGSQPTSIEMINVTQTGQRPDGENDQPTEIKRPLDVACREDEASRLLNDCMTRLHEVQQAKAALIVLTVCELRAVLEFRRKVLGGEPA